MMFMIMNTITIVDLLNTSIHNTKIKNGFLIYHSFRLHFISFQDTTVVSLHIFYYPDGQAAKTITIASTITMITQLWPVHLVS